MSWGGAHAALQELQSRRHDHKLQLFLKAAVLHPHNQQKSCCGCAIHRQELSGLN